MKCIECGSKTPGGRARTTGRCGACHHPYAFLGVADPLQIHDFLFASAIERVSERGTHWYTERQLWHELLRRMPGAPKIGCAAAGVLALVAPLVLLGGAIGASAPVERALAPRLPFDTFRDRYLARWIEVHGTPSRLVDRAMVEREAPAPSEELAAYSFDRALVVQTADLAAMLVANRFHFENNCAIVSLDRRFPAGATFPAIHAMLLRNPGLRVHVLHDASREGLAMAQQLRSPEWFPDTAVRIADLGLTPAQARAARIPSWSGDPIPEATEIPLPTEEADALRAGNRWDLESMRPARLLSVAWRGFSRVAEHATADSWNDDGIWIAGYGWGPGLWMVDSGWHAHDHWGGTLASDIDAGAADSFG
ncbi:MAG: hypothetical protein ACKO5K_09025 [Armatimonadota bacterium]